MIDKNTLSSFVKEVDHAYQQFSVWKYCNNQYAEHCDNFEEKLVQHWATSVEEFMQNNRTFQNFWEVTLPSLQHAWMISVCRLMDPAFFQNDKTKPNLSLDYIIEHLDNDVLINQIRLSAKTHSSYTKHMKTWRDKYLAHNDFNFAEQTIEAGYEDYIEFLVETIKNIKKQYPHLKDCNNVDLIWLDRVSETGVKEVFEKLSVD